MHQTIASTVVPRSIKAEGSGTDAVSVGVHLAHTVSTKCVSPLEKYMPIEVLSNTSMIWFSA